MLLGKLRFLKLCSMENVFYLIKISFTLQDVVIFFNKLFPSAANGNISEEETITPK